MAMRISKTLLENRAKAACKAIGLEYGEFYSNPRQTEESGRIRANVGRVHLENAGYGWNLVQCVNESGGETHINGWCNGLKASEMLAWLNGIIFAAERLAKREG